MVARDVMTPDPACISTTATLADAVELLYALDVRHLPVVDEDGALVGMLSDRDLRTFALGPREDLGRALQAMNAPVASLMSTEIVAVDPETDVAEVIDLMLQNHLAAVPVTEPSSHSELLGIVSYFDLLRNIYAQEVAA